MVVSVWLIKLRKLFNAAFALLLMETPDADTA